VKILLRDKLEGITPIRDDYRHLVCLPYSIENLHKMAEFFGIGRHFFHGGRHPHYDIPSRRRLELEGGIRGVSSGDIIRIIQGLILGPEELGIRKPV
jgi:hypothetical protein